jgi:hypothetical protein
VERGKDEFSQLMGRLVEYNTDCPLLFSKI